MSLSKKEAVIAVLILVLLIGFLLSVVCYSNWPREPNQLQYQEVKCLQLEARAREAEKKATENQVALDKKDKEYEVLVQERDRLVQERGDYPRNTPEDVIKENKTLRLQLVKNDTVSSIGYRKLVDLLEDNRTLRAENFGFKKENQAARIYLEGKGIYFSNATGKTLDETKSPLFIEKEEHKETIAELKLEKAKRDAGKYYYEAQILKLDQELAKTIQERNLYKIGYEQWRNYAKSFEDPKPNP